MTNPLSIMKTSTWCQRRGAITAAEANTKGWLRQLSTGLALASMSCSSALTHGQDMDTGTGKPEQILMTIVAEKAKNLAEKPYQEPSDSVPKALQQLDYDQYRGIRFDSEQALWHNQTQFEVQFFHPGFLYRNNVELDIVDREGLTRRQHFDSDFFSYENAKTKQLAQQAGTNFGYSGFRIHFPINTQKYKDEVAVFQGASYFRLVGPSQVYGLSARGLAIDTAEPNGEEFPRFKHFWLLQPAADSHQFTFFALLDSPSITGAYRFTLDVSTSTTVEVKNVLYPRHDIGKVGIAPLTSMFFFGESSLRNWDDTRPEVHDSDGLLLHNKDDQWIWRPLSNPKSLQTTSLLSEHPKGFGLLQRDRKFDHYLDIESHYQNRPSLWVTPRGDWGKGRVELVEIPTDSETNDNIVAYWVPDHPFKAGREYQFDYRLNTFDTLHREQPLAEVVRTQTGWGAIPGQQNPPPRSVRQFVIDFSGAPLDALSTSTPIDAAISNSSGKISDVTVVPLPDHHGWRVAFRLTPDTDKVADLQLHLRLRNQRLSEEWSYVWNPNRISE